MRRAGALRVLVVVVSAAGSGCQDPYGGDGARPTPAPAAIADDHVRPGPTAPRLPSRVAKASASPRGTARRFATLWANWDWRNVASRQRALARLAAGDLARQMRANASSVRIDASLVRDKPASRGIVAAIKVKLTREHATGLVVTREQTYTDGRADLGGRRYRVYRVRLRRAGAGWEVARWEPQP